MKKPSAIFRGLATEAGLDTIPEWFCESTVGLSRTTGERMFCAAFRRLEAAQRWAKRQARLGNTPLLSDEWQARVGELRRILRGSTRQKG